MLSPEVIAVAGHGEAIQHVANMVTANSAEDEVTAAKLNERIDGLASGLEAGRAQLAEHGANAEAEHEKLRQAVQVIADLVTKNSQEDEVTAAKLNARIDAIEAGMSGSGLSVEVGEE